MINQTTSHVRLPLPHPSNLLQEDVLRLRTALTNLDGLIWLLNQTTSEVLAKQLVQIALPATQSLTYTNGLVTKVTETLVDNSTRETTYTYDNNLLASETMTVGGQSYRTTYHYQSGVMTGYTRELLS